MIPTNEVIQAEELFISHLTELDQRTVYPMFHDQYKVYMQGRFSYDELKQIIKAYEESGLTNEN